MPATVAEVLNDPLRIGFIGAGFIATYHSKSLHRSARVVERAGVFDPVRARAEAFAESSGHLVCDSEAEVIDSCDALYVCTWTSEHLRQVEAAVGAGRHIFCEKPLALTLPDAQRLVDIVSPSGLVHQVGLVLRRSPAYVYAKHLIDDPAAGAVMTVVFRDDQFIPIQGHYGSTWRADRTLAGSGTLMEHSIHDVDMLHFLVGPIAKVSAATRNHHGHHGIEDVATALVQFASGATGTLTSVWHDNLARPSLRRVEVFCERRYVVIEGDDWFGPVSWTDSDGTEGSLTGEALGSALRSISDEDDNPDGAFVDAVVNGTPAWPDLHVALDAHRVVDAMYRSAASDCATVAV
jgi:predicted dehydrogenase